MRKKDRKTIRGYFCWLFGHRSLCLFHRTLKNCNIGSEITGWKCEHCEREHTAQWDNPI